MRIKTKRFHSNERFLLQLIEFKYVKKRIFKVENMQCMRKTTIWVSTQELAAIRNRYNNLKDTKHKNADTISTSRKYVLSRKYHPCKEESEQKDAHHIAAGDRSTCKAESINAQSALRPADRPDPIIFCPDRSPTSCNQFK